MKGAPGGHGPYSLDAGSWLCPECDSKLRRPRVFCASLADWLDDEVPIEWLADLLKLIHDTPNLDWLLLTKRPENFFERMAQVVLCNIKKPGLAWDYISPWTAGRNIPANVSIGTSVEDQQRANERIPELLQIPAKIRFLSVEPMLGPIDFSGWFWESGCKPHCGDRCSKDADCPMERTDKLHWAIFGGESGPGARPCNIEWIREGVKQCRAAGVAPFVKQLGASSVSSHELADSGRPLLMRWNDKKGGDMAEWPEDLKIREFPNPQPA